MNDAFFYLFAIERKNYSDCGLFEWCIKLKRSWEYSIVSLASKKRSHFIFSITFITISYLNGVEHRLMTFFILPKSPIHKFYDIIYLMIFFLNYVRIKSCSLHKLFHTNVSNVSAFKLTWFCFSNEMNNTPTGISMTYVNKSVYIIFDSLKRRWRCSWCQPDTYDTRDAKTTTNTQFNQMTE